MMQAKSRTARPARPHGDAKSALARERAGGAGGDLHEVFFMLRQGILDGVMPPGQVLNQVHLAERFGVSRTPVREALRLLQAEGLVEAKFQHRMRVTPVTPAEVDAVYAMWITLNALAIGVSVPRLTAAELAAIRAAQRAMNARSPVARAEPEGARSGGDWSTLHRAFHRSLLAHADPAILAAIDTCWSRSERARRTFLRTTPASWRESEREHATMVAAYAARSLPEAIGAMAGQLARIAYSVIANIDPAYRPNAIPQALALVGVAAAVTADTSGSRTRHRG